MILKVSSLLENGKDVTSFLGTVNDSSCSLAVADVHDLNILRRKFFCKTLVKLSLGSHSETYETVFKWKLIRLAVTFYKESIISTIEMSAFLSAKNSTTSRPTAPPPTTTTFLPSRSFGKSLMWLIIPRIE